MIILLYYFIDNLVKYCNRYLSNRSILFVRYNNLENEEYTLSNNQDTSDNIFNDTTNYTSDDILENNNIININYINTNYVSLLSNDSDDSDYNNSNEQNQIILKLKKLNNFIHAMFSNYNILIEKLVKDELYFLYLINYKNNEMKQYNYSNFETRIIISSNSDSDNNDNNILNNISTINNTNVYIKNQENNENNELNVNNDTYETNENSKDNENAEINYIIDKLKNKNAQCSICLEEYSNNNSNIIQLECQHYYHLDCFIQWVIKQKYEIIKRLEQNNHNLREEDISIYCPECKKKFPKIMKLY